MYVCVCVYTYIHICICIYIYICVWCVCMYVYIHTHIHVHTYVHKLHAYAHILCACVRVFMYVCMYAFICACTYDRECMCMHIWWICMVENIDLCILLVSSHDVRNCSHASYVHKLIHARTQVHAHFAPLHSSQPYRQTNTHLHTHQLRTHFILIITYELMLIHTHIRTREWTHLSLLFIAHSPIIIKRSFLQVPLSRNNIAPLCRRCYACTKAPSSLCTIIDQFVGVHFRAKTKGHIW